MSVDPAKFEAAVVKGNEAQNELRLTRDAFAKVRQEFIDAWQGTMPEQDKAREKLWLASAVLTRVEGILRGYVENGVIAVKEIERLKRTGDKPGFFRRAV